MPVRSIDGFWVEHVIDWEGGVVHNAIMNEEGRLLKVTEGDYGEATPAGYFQDNDLCEAFRPTDNEVI